MSFPNGSLHASSSAAGGSKTSSQAHDGRDLLLKIAREMVAAQDVDELLQTIVDAALRIVPNADKCVIHLLDPSGTKLRARVCSKPSPIGAETSGFPADTGIAGRALRERKLCRIDDTRRDSDFVPLHSSADLRSLLVAPLYVADSRLGTCSLSSSRLAAFDERDSQYVRTLAAQASVAIEQTHLLMEIKAHRERSDTIIESIADGLFILQEGYITRVNPALCRLLDLPRDGIRLPQNIKDNAAGVLGILVDPAAEIIGPYEVKSPALSHLSPSQAAEHPSSSHMKEEIPSKGERILEVIPSTLGEQSEAKVLLVHDVTPERTASERRGLFISQVSHELRTPLQHILSFVSLSLDLDDLQQEDRERFLMHIENETYNLARLVDDLMELSRIEMGRFSTYMGLQVLYMSGYPRDVLNRTGIDIEAENFVCKPFPLPELAQKIRALLD